MLIPVLYNIKNSTKNYDEAQKRLILEDKIYNLAKYKSKIGAASELDELQAKEAYLMCEKKLFPARLIL